MPAIIATTKVTSKGQITIPQTIREQSGIQPGDNIIFTSDEEGRVLILGSNFESLRVEAPRPRLSDEERTARINTALDDFQNAIGDEAETAGLRTEDDIVKLVNDLRSGKEI